jgi:hypothetical protein
MGDRKVKAGKRGAGFHASPVSWAAPGVSAGGVLLRLEGQVPYALWRIGNFPNRGPGLFIVRDDELIHARRDHVALHAIGIGKQHEGLFASRRRGRIHHGLSRAIVIVNFDEIADLNIKLRHILRVHFDERVWPPVHDEVVLLV